MQIKKNGGSVLMTDPVVIKCHVYGTVQKLREISFKISFITGKTNIKIYKKLELKVRNVMLQPYYLKHPYISSYKLIKSEKWNSYKFQ